MSRTIPRLLEAAVSEVPDKVWLLHEDETYTYGQAAERIARAAAGLAALGIGRGDLVLATAHNRPAYVFTWLAAAHLGAIYVPTDPRATPREFEGMVGQVAPKAIVTDDNAGRLFEHDPVASGASPAQPDDPVILIPTSGTTGRSKLVTQTHLAYVMAGEGFPWWMELTADDRLMTSLPLFHVNATAYSVIGSLAARASLALLPRFSAGTFLDSARRYGATEFNAIGAMLEMLMRQPERDDDADNPLRLCYTGPSPARERQLEIERRFGLQIICGYAMSETPYGLIWPRGTRPYGTLGSPRQHPTLGQVNEARVVDDELQLRNPAVMKGYWGMPEETAEVLGPDGWLRTGDLVRDDGSQTYTYVGRRKEIIRRRGENVATAEIEEALVSHPQVIEAAVVGVPSELTEEEIKAFVVLGDDGAAELGTIRDWAAERLTRFKVPRYLEAVDALPYTPTGRVAKHKLPRERTETEVDFA
jgi:crotonobetaine/carnitine-CoA ligase